MTRRVVGLLGVLILSSSRLGGQATETPTVTIIDAFLVAALGSAAGILIGVAVVWSSRCRGYPLLFSVIGVIASPVAIFLLLAASEVKSFAPLFGLLLAIVALALVLRPFLVARARSASAFPGRA